MAGKVLELIPHFIAKIQPIATYQLILGPAQTIGLNTNVTVFLNWGGWKARAAMSSFEHHITNR